jgi:hypothetical protein
MHGEGPTQLLGARARVERTLNIWNMVVTLEVSKLSGWLNADVPFRVEGRGTCEAGRVAGREAGGRGAAAAQAASTGRARLRAWRLQGKRGAHPEYSVHVRDLGGVKAQRLVEGARELPSRRERHAMWGEVRAGRREGLGRRRGAKAACTGKARLKAWEGRRARAERTANMAPMSVTSEVSKLSGWLKAYACCRVEGRGTCTCDAGRGAGREAGGRGRRRRKRHRRGRPDLRLFGGRAREERT